MGAGCYGNKEAYDRIEDLETRLRFVKIIFLIFLFQEIVILQS